MKIPEPGAALDAEMRCGDDAVRSWAAQVSLSVE
jgi:hypothetical protein